MSVPSLTSLLKQSHVTDHDEILKAANKALQSDKHDTKAQHVKLVALLKLDRFEDAVRVVETGDKGLGELAKLEHAYALYKSGRRTEAAEIARNSSSRGLQHVEAQALYGIENFERASDIYKSLSDNPQEDAIADLRINVLAVNAQLEWSHLGQHVENSIMTREDFEAYEAVYNMACISIARGELGQCEVLLKRAKQLLENMQDMTEEEKENELLPTNIQHIFVLTRLGRYDEAQELASQLDLARITDPLTNHIAEVNTEAAKHTDANPFLLQRQLNIDLDAFEPGAAFGFQTAAFMRNRYALDLGAMKFEGTAASTEALLAKQSDGGATTSAKLNTVSVFNAAAHSKNQTGKAGLKFILPLLEKRPNDVGLLLTVIQIHVLNNNPFAAIELLTTFLTRLEESGENAKNADVRYAPGLIATLISLNVSLGRVEEARLQLAKAAAYWRGRTAPQELTPGVVHLLKAAGSALLAAAPAEQQQHDDDGEDRAKAAKAIFEHLLAWDARDKYAAAGLVAASSTTDTAASDISGLANFDKLTASIDADALERSGIAQRTTSADAQAANAKKRSAPSTETNNKGRNKKIRQSKIPKEYDPSKTPDPERWLPLRDRSTYKPKGKKNKAKQAMLSQGAVSGVDNSGSDTINNHSSTTSAVAADVVKGKSAQGANSNTSNKKKKPKKK